ncbi:DUF6879 family protein [Streptomyces rubradiris]|uniref:DUF6879 domain-containing protein n=1 Tax=Streptomyces rubradiris TaxID=285531 RepID=A0ABQ3RNI3_STRRR|nr:DUF6879 family protein [Streptomyces rubradiris]GHH13101.1 hypothetical protein GCM10018792_39470 [Streptomyces rubradiris]GHI57426.1 hypothetical protein Srubr_72720 [Streptomyces rubradiris]
MLLDGEEWAARFRSFQREAWRLETLPEYRVPQEAEEIKAYLAGERIDPHAYSNEYTDDLKQLRREGKSKGRVHIVTRPLSDYLRFEFMYYQPHAWAGDDIRIMDVTGRPNPLQGVQDFWMFDQSEVVLMNYEPDGTQISREVFEGDVTPFLEYQRIALAESVPFEEYVKGLDA